MKSRTITHELLNGGKPTEIFYPITEKELDDQINEIFKFGNYRFANKTGGVYWDVGANIGLSVLYFSNFAKEIYAMEPSPLVYEALVKNVGHLPNVKLFNLALATGNGKDLLFGGTDGQLPQTFFDRRGGSKDFVVVKCVSPESFLADNGIDHVDVMKIDVEEAEYIILPSSTFGRVAPQIDAVIGEAHVTIYQADGGFPETIPLIMDEWGYATEFPKLEHPNYAKRLVVSDPASGTYKEYIYNMDTIFVSRRKKDA